MALPTLDAVFASAADVPRRYMLSQWLVGEIGETDSNSSVLVSGAGSSEANGTYTYRGESIGKPYYNLVGQPDNIDESAISWNGDDWTIRRFDQETLYNSSEDVEFPWLVSWSSNAGDEPAPTVTEVPPQAPTVANYITLPERYLWAKIAVAAGAPKDEAFYINAPKQYAWKDIYDAVSGSSLGTIDWGEKQALGHIAAAYRGDTGNPANLATYIDWPWRYQVASIITALAAEGNPTPQPNGNGGPTTFNAVIVSGAGSTEVNGTYTERGEYNGKPYYNLVGEPSSVLIKSIFYDSGGWAMEDSIEGTFYYAESDAPFPWLAENWISGGYGEEPVPTFTPTNV
jgi:hypothetical protein